MYVNLWRVSVGFRNRSIRDSICKFICIFTSKCNLYSLNTSISLFETREPLVQFKVQIRAYFERDILCYLLTL